MKMLKRFSIILALLLFSSPVSALPVYEIITSSVPVSSCGDITRIAVASENLGGKVIVDIWTPEGYDPSSDKRYPVVYVHDGQKLFDASFSFAGVPWAIDKAC